MNCCGNRTAPRSRYLRPPKSSLRHFRAMKDGRELMLDELPAQRAARGEHVQDFEFSLVFDDGTTRHLLAYGTPLWTIRGNPRGAVHTLVDITERKRDEEELVKTKTLAENRAIELQAIMEAVPALVFITHDPQGSYMTGNRATHDLLGVPLEGNVSKSAPQEEQPATFHAMRDGQEILADQLPVQQAAQGHEVRDYELDLVFTDGTTRTIFGNATPLKGLDGDTNGAVGVFIDITQRKQMEEELRNSQRLLRDIIDSSPSAIFLKDRDGKFITVNKPLEKMLGTTQEELEGKTDYDIASKDMADYWRSHDEQVMKTGLSMQIEEVADLKDGHHVFLANKFPLVDASGQIYGVCAISHDITERKQAEEALRQQAEEFQHLLDVVPAAVWIARDPECLTIIGNRRAEQFYEAGSGENVSATTLPDDRQFFDRNGRELAARELPMQLSTATNQEVRDCELNVRLSSGRQITMLGSAIPLRDANGDVRGCIGTFIDITDRKRMEEELRKSHDELELRVHERTEALQEAYAKLKEEIAERGRAEEALDESEKRYHTLFDAIDQGFCIVEVIFDENERPIDYRFLEINAAFEKQTGLIDARGKRMRELAPKA